MLTFTDTRPSTHIVGELRSEIVVDVDCKDEHSLKNVPLDGDAQFVSGIDLHRVGRVGSKSISERLGVPNFVLCLNHEVGTDPEPRLLVVAHNQVIAVNETADMSDSVTISTSSVAGLHLFLDTPDNSHQ
ncbi:hypothetical protein CVN56_31425 [Rhodococcus sp. AQ5-07]|nr:hypothetical protein CVN56_31425 [Rhodococcus sp. AQ5-07]